MQFAVYMMIGPGEAESLRLCTLLKSLFRHEPGLPLLILINDSRADLPPLDRIVPTTCEVVELPSPSGGEGARHSQNILLALRTLLKQAKWEFAFKLDTDALVIAPFSAKVGRYLAENPTVGQVGQSGRDCDGKEVDVDFYARYHRRLTSRIQIWRSPDWGVAQSFFGRRAVMRRLVQQAAHNGLTGGRHCQGGAYAITRAAVRRLAEADLLETDPAGIVMNATDDLMLSTIVAAVGFKVTSLTAPGEPFAIVNVGLPMLPAELVMRGYSIIHSIKNDNRVSERSIVEYFEARDRASPARA